MFHRIHLKFQGDAWKLTLVQFLCGMREEIIKMGYKKLSATNEQKAIERASMLACCLKDYKTLIKEVKRIKVPREERI